MLCRLMWIQFFFCQFTDPTSYQALFYFLVVKPAITMLISLGLVVVGLPLIILILPAPAALRVIRKIGIWQANVAIDGLYLAVRWTMTNLCLQSVVYFKFCMILRFFPYRSWTPPLHAPELLSLVLYPILYDSNVYLKKEKALGLKVDQLIWEYVLDAIEQ